ncbi:hypothetical protein K469DRAFT_710407 [Zopfia rhizophila CBS 207.26]|uniref:Uncharacterized protein n=1 Tax=Zopfia rhizophila CBS 207.26 TaxID=1314779 RepID=A0A6A6E078_9PEZI|nr:hypothetical protein K469DRAFT_710407 [Zopfia rhizophila CBS 207.26]
MAPPLSIPPLPSPPLSDSLQSKLSIYTRTTDKGNMIDCYFFKECGLRVFHRIRDKYWNGRDMTSMKASVIGGEVELGRAKHIFTRKGRDTTPFPERKSPCCKVELDTISVREGTPPESPIFASLSQFWATS